MKIYSRLKKMQSDKDPLIRFIMLDAVEMYVYLCIYSNYWY
jgi:hypothetical protein